MNSAVIGTFSAAASDCSVASEGAVWPFSIFDSIATESPAACATSEAVMLSDWRSAFTCAPSASIRWLVDPFGADGLAARRRRIRDFVFVWSLFLVRKDGPSPVGIVYLHSPFVGETQDFSVRPMQLLHGRVRQSCARA